VRSPLFASLTLAAALFPASASARADSCIPIPGTTLLDCGPYVPGEWGTVVELPSGSLPLPSTSPFPHLSPAQRAALLPGEIAGRLPGVHAEV